MSFSFLDDLIRMSLKGIRSAGRSAGAIDGLIDDIFRNDTLRNQLIGALRSGDGSIDDVLKSIKNSGQLSDDAAKALAQYGDELANIAKRSAQTIGRHGDAFAKIEKGLASGTFKNADDLVRFAETTSLKGTDFLTALRGSADDIIRKTATGSTHVQRAALSRLQGGFRSAAAAPRRMYDSSTSLFRKTSYQQIDLKTGLYKSIPRSEYSASLRAMGSEMKTLENGLPMLREVPGGFSKMRIAAGAGGFLLANQLTDDLTGVSLTDGMAYMVKGSWSPLAWVIKKTAGGAVEAGESVADATGVDLGTIFNTEDYKLGMPQWLIDSGVWQEEDGIVFMNPKNGEIPASSEYKELYDKAESEGQDMSVVMSPELYAQKYPAFLAAAKKQYEQGRAKDPQSRMAAFSQVDVDALSGPDLSRAFKTAQDAVNSGEINFGTEFFGFNPQKMLFNLVAGLAGLAEFLGAGDMFQRMAVRMAQGHVAKQFGDVPAFDKAIDNARGMIAGPDRSVVPTPAYTYDPSSPVV